ncbi:MAG: hypothetical protein ACRD50_11110 [Candidatus Acidiferrales bacterium]
MERKYRQRGYEDRGREDKEKKRDRPQQQPPRPRQEQLGPRTPRMVGTVMRARCSNCGSVLATGFDPNGQCPRCGLEMHSCKQCVHFDTAAQFECTQPIPERIAKKDAKNDCTFFELRMTVEKDTSPTMYAQPATAAAPASPARPGDARKAFEDLFKK